MFFLVALFIEPLVGLALPGSITVRYFDRAFQLPRYIGTGVTLALTAAVLVELGVFVLREPLSDLTSVPRSGSFSLFPSSWPGS